MLLSPDFVTTPAPKQVWFNNLTPMSGPAIAEVTDSSVQPRARMRHKARLRRMQSQNFIQRAVSSVFELFDRDAA